MAMYLWDVLHERHVEMCDVVSLFFQLDLHSFLMIE